MSIPVAGLEMWPTSRVQVRPINPNTHSLDQIEQIVASMRRFGWTMPLLVDEAGVLLAGHGRLRAGRMMGVEEVPVLVAKGWSEDEKRAYVILDNQLARNSEWDSKQLKHELKALMTADFDMGLVGFSDDELQSMVFDSSTLEPDKKTEPEEVTMRKCGECGRYSRKV